ncbi:MAG: hypothetical protein LUM44_14105 [Pyrinomonadaceae bacterium]|nr:hypothetical protein [Pyrinomonadaceae bacterium]
MMKFVPKYFFLLSLTLFFTACGADESQNAANNPPNSNVNQANFNEKKITAKDNIEELETLVKIPFHPEEAMWREEVLGGQNSKKITAVLKFLPEESTKVVAEAEAKKPATPTTIPVETWFPAELVAQSELSGDDTLKGNAYSAEQFFQPPYADGRLIRMENSNYFVLELLSK